jgi:hypothetical protein
LGTEEIRDIAFGRACYKGWHSPATVSYVIGLGLLLLLNILAVPIIDSNKNAFLGHNGVRLGWAALLIEYYWQVTLVCIVLAATALLVSLLRAHALTRGLLDPRQDKDKPPKGKHEKGKPSPAAQAKG